MFPRDPEFVFPFKVGATWDEQWRVTSKLSETVPAGAFDDCYELTSQTRSEQKKWVCAGVGVVAYEYPGEEAGSHYRIELMNFMISGGLALHHPTLDRPRSTGANRTF